MNINKKLKVIDKDLENICLTLSEKVEAIDERIEKEIDIIKKRNLETKRENILYILSDFENARDHIQVVIETLDTIEIIK
jgi:molecular chaperone GrpE (heat shock protein)